MSVATICAGVATILRSAGAKNVEVEETTTREPDPTGREDGSELHWWRVRATALPGIGGAGYTDKRHALRIEGQYGLRRESGDPTEKSDPVWSALVSAVVAALESPLNAHPGNAIDFEGLSVASSGVTNVTHGATQYPMHTVTITAVYVEES